MVSEVMQHPGFYAADERALDHVDMRSKASYAAQPRQEGKEDHLYMTWASLRLTA